MKSHTDNADPEDEPEGAMILKASELPKWMPPSTENDDPSRAVHKTVSDEPHRLVLRSANDSPRWGQPYTGNEKPMRAMLRKANEFPKR